MRWLSGTLIATLLFMQFAVAAHACAVPAPNRAAEAMPDCPGHAAEKSRAAAGERDDAPQLCKAHCERGSQAVGASAVSVDGPVASVTVAVLDWRPVDLLAAPGPAGAAPRLASGAPPPGSPPLYLSLLVLRN